MPIIQELGIDHLNHDQRVELALALWESLDKKRPHFAPSKEWIDEMERRNREMDEQPERSLTWEQMLHFLETR